MKTNNDPSNRPEFIDSAGDLKEAVDAVPPLSLFAAPGGGLFNEATGDADIQPLRLERGVSTDRGSGSTKIISSSVSKPLSEFPPSTFKIRHNGHTRSQEFDTLNVWIGAEHARQHLNQRRLQIAEEFVKHKIGSFQYALYAGFDESLVRDGIGYLEQIHVITSASVPATSSLLPSLGKICSPFSSILFTQSSKYPLPLFKPDGSCWDFDNPVYESMASYIDRGATAAMYPTVISLSQTTGGPSSASVSAQSFKNTDNKRKGREIGREDEHQEKDDDVNSDAPGGEPTKISFNVVSEIYSATPQCDTPNILQILTVQGSFMIHDSPPKTTGVEFTSLKFDSTPTTTDTAYQQHYLRIAVDSGYPHIDVTGHKPKRTRAFNRQPKVTIGTKTVSSFLGRVGATLGLIQISHETLTVIPPRTIERTGYKSRITQTELYGVVWWGFEVDDAHDRAAGLKFSEDMFPRLTIEYPISLMISRPDLKESGCIDVELSSCWSIIPLDTQEPGWIERLLSQGASTDIPYSNLCQILVLSVPRHQSHNSSYKAKVQVPNQSVIQYGNLERESSLDLSSIKLAPPRSVMMGQPKRLENESGPTTEVPPLEKDPLIPLRIQTPSTERLASGSRSASTNISENIRRAALCR